MTLLVDAAHSRLQSFAQGDCVVIVDAVVLADAMTAVPEDITGTFQAYQTHGNYAPASAK